MGGEPAIVVERRKELTYLLCQAAELEHALMCQYPAAWQRWEFRWRTPGPGSHTLRARATDVTGATQPVTVPGNTFGYHFGGIAQHPVITA